MTLHGTFESVALALDRSSSWLRPFSFAETFASRTLKVNTREGYAPLTRREVIEATVSGIFGAGLSDFLEFAYKGISRRFVRSHFSIDLDVVDADNVARRIGDLDQSLPSTERILQQTNQRIDAIQEEIQTIGDILFNYDRDRTKLSKEVRRFLRNEMERLNKSIKRGGILGDQKSEAVTDLIQLNDTLDNLTIAHKVLVDSDQEAEIFGPTLYNVGDNLIRPWLQNLQSEEDPKGYTFVTATP